MNINIITLTLILLFETFVIYKILKWSLLKSIGASVVMNIGSALVSVFVQNIVAQKLPTDIWLIQNVVAHYALLMLGLSLVTLVVTIFTEYFILSLFNKDKKTSLNLWPMVIGMNIVSLSALTALLIFTNNPEISESYTLKATADWIEPSNQHLFFIEWKNKELVDWQIGNKVSSNLFETSPMTGYRISQGQTIIKTPSNTVYLAEAKKSFSNKISNCWQTALSIKANQLAILEHEYIHLYNLSDQTLVNSIKSEKLKQADSIYWHKNLTNLIVSIDTNLFMLNYAKSFVDFIPVSSDQTLATTCFDNSSYNQLTNKFKYAETEISVYLRNGLEIKTAQGSSFMQIDTKAAPSLYSGIGFINQGQTFLFQFLSYGHEIMALNLETGEIGNVARGFFATLSNTWPQGSINDSN